MNTRISQDDDRQLDQLARFTGQGHYLCEAPGPGDDAAFAADPCIPLGGWAANQRVHGQQLQAELQGRTHGHRIAATGPARAPSAAELSAYHSLAHPETQRRSAADAGGTGAGGGGIAGPFDTVQSRLTDPASQYRQAVVAPYFTARPTPRPNLVRLHDHLAAAPVRMRGDTFKGGAAPPP